MKAYVINLIKDTRRKLHMQELCAKYGLQPEFIEAVDGKSLTVEDMAKVYSNALAIEKLGRELSRGEIGCALSHKNVYKKMIDENIEMALILEDDVDFDENLLKILNQKESFINNWELILFGHHTVSSRKVDTAPSIWDQKKLIEKFKLVRPCEKAYGTYGYLVRKCGAERLLKHLTLIYKPIDHYTGDSKYINLYTINPAPIKIHDEMSDGFHSMHDRTELQKKLSIAIENQTESFKKKIAKFLGLYQILIDLRSNIKMSIKKIRPLRKYQFEKKGTGYFLK